jgi:lysophospholipase L1-like esterase
MIGNKKVINHKIALVLIGLFLISFISPKYKIHVFMIGDSTMANKMPEKYPETGWGQVFGALFNNNATIINKAMNGRSTKSFITENRWEEVKNNLKKGDYVFIQFGHNDEKINNLKLGTSIKEYHQNLVKYVTETRAKNANPILLTPIERRIFKSDTLYDSHGLYPQEVRKVAIELNVPIIDLQKKSHELLLSYGVKESTKLFLHLDSGLSKNYPLGIKDNTHFSKEGAKCMANIVAQSIKEMKLPLANYLN